MSAPEATAAGTVGSGAETRDAGETLRVGFLGVGAIGLPMAVRLLAGGHAVTAIDSSAARRELAAQHGVPASETLGGQAFDAVIVMVATPAQLRAVVSEGGLPQTLDPDTLCIVMSTVGPRAVQEAEAILNASGIEVVDVPVSGGVSGAKAGRLALFAAGRADLLARARPLFRCLGREWPCGARVGDGQAVKLVNQLLCSVNLVAAAEALAFAGRLGLDQAGVLDMLGSGAAASWMLADRGPRMLAGTDVEVTSVVDIFLKDSGLVAEATRELGLTAPLIEAAHQRFREAVALDLGRRDDSRVIETYA